MLLRLDLPTFRLPFPTGYALILALVGAHALPDSVLCLFGARQHGHERRFRKFLGPLTGHPGAWHPGRLSDSAASKFIASRDPSHRHRHKVQGCMWAAAPPSPGTLSS